CDHTAGFVATGPDYFLYAGRVAPSPAGAGNYRRCSKAGCRAAGCAWSSAAGLTDGEFALDQSLGLGGSFVVFIHDLARSGANDRGGDRSSFDGKKLAVVRHDHRARRADSGDGRLVCVRSDLALITQGSNSDDAL